MRFRLKTRKLQELYGREKHASDYPGGVVDAFFEVMAIIDSAKDPRDLYALKGLRFEKLPGRKTRGGDRSLRLTKQWRLEVSLERDTKGPLLLVHRISKHYE